MQYFVLGYSPFLCHPRTSLTTYPLSTPNPPKHHPLQNPLHLITLLSLGTPPQQMLHLRLLPLPHTSTPLHLTPKTELHHPTPISLHNPVSLVTLPIHQPSLLLAPPLIPTQALFTSDTIPPILNPPTTTLRKQLSEINEIPIQFL